MLCEAALDVHRDPGVERAVRALDEVDPPVGRLRARLASHAASVAGAAFAGQFPAAPHAGAGVASLVTGGLYPTIGDSVYVDLNVKFAK